MASTESPVLSASGEDIRLALDEALSILDASAKAAVLDHFEREYFISLKDGDSPLSREEVVYALNIFFLDGGSLIMRLFDRCLASLQSASNTRQLTELS